MALQKTICTAVVYACEKMKVGMCIYVAKSYLSVFNYSTCMYFESTLLSTEPQLQKDMKIELL